MHSKIVVENVWKLEHRREAVIRFWKQNGMQWTDEQYVKRSGQLVYVALNETEQIVAVTTAVPTAIRGLNNLNFFNFRILIDKDFRIPGLLDKMAVGTINFLEELFINKQTDCIGVITLMENEKLNNLRREAVLPSTGFVFIGNSKNGAQIRVKYFKGAKI